ncbi:hypothetical protein RJ641_007041 [Dillenia turbinata]|uniref:Mitochondrial inner membrane protease ATP23 n=1 Tax=Dillenia turbinata TaxID=194707 RepID=A0AAN8V6I7_9MAGN
MEHLAKPGCAIGDNFIKAIYCDQKISGGHVRSEGIMACSNHMNLQDDINQSKILPIITLC